MSGDGDFARELRDRADATVPVIPVDTAWVLPRARRRRAVARAVAEGPGAAASRRAAARLR